MTGTVVHKPKVFQRNRRPRHQHRLLRRHSSLHHKHPTNRMARGKQLATDDTNPLAPTTLDSSNTPPLCPHENSAHAEQRSQLSQEHRKLPWCFLWCSHEPWSYRLSRLSICRLSRPSRKKRPVESQGDVHKKSVLDERKTCAYLYMAATYLFKKLCQFGDRWWCIANLRSEIKWKRFVMSEYIHDTWTGTLLKSAQNKRTHLITNPLPPSCLNALGTDHGRVIVCRNRQRYYRQYARRL